jgi:hypothetical protein
MGVIQSQPHSQPYRVAAVRAGAGEGRHHKQPRRLDEDETTSHVIGLRYKADQWASCECEATHVPTTGASGGGAVAGHGGAAAGGVAVEAGHAVQVLHQRQVVRAPGFPCVRFTLRNSGRRVLIHNVKSMKATKIRFLFIDGLRFQIKLFSMPTTKT